MQNERERKNEERGALKGRGRNDESVRDVMTANPSTVTESQNLQEVARIMLKEDCGAVPVVDNGKKIIGMITDRDIVIRVVAKGTNPSSATVADAMSRDVHCVRENDSMDKVFGIMADQQVRRVPVVDSDDRVIGIIAQADLATNTDEERKVARTIEEISEKPGER